MTLASTDKISQTIATVDADFTVDKRSRLFDVNAVGKLSPISIIFKMLMAMSFSAASTAPRMRPLCQFGG